MRACPLFLGAGLALFTGSAAAQRSLTGASQPGIDVVHYEFSVDFPARPIPDTVRFVSSVSARRTARTESIALDLTSGLSVDGVTVNGAEARFRHDSSKVRISLPTGTGDTLRIVVR